jgi:hypothetical protein
MNTIIKYANDIIKEASSETKTWTTSFHDKLIKSITKMTKQEANLFIKIIMNETLKKNSKPFSQFKLCQICSIIRNKDLKSFQNAFLPFHSKINEYLNTETETTLDSAIKSPLTKLLKEYKKMEITIFSTFRY